MTKYSHFSHQFQHYERGITMRKEGKRVFSLISVILMLAMAVSLFAGCSGNQGGTETTPQVTEPEEYTLYYNTNKNPELRVNSQDNTVHVPLYGNGRSTSIRCTTIEVATELCKQEIFALELNDQYLTIGTKSVESLGAKFVSEKNYISSIEGNKITVKTTADETGTALPAFEINADTVITDVTGQTPVGFTPTLRDGDCITAVANSADKVTHIFIIARGAGTRKALCEHCDQEVDWKAVYPSDGVVPSDDGHYYLTGNIVSTSAKVNAATVVLDLNGFTVIPTPGEQLYTLSHSKSELHLLDTSEAKTGGIIASQSDLTSGGGIVYIGNVGGAKFVMYGGTIDASKITTTGNGAAVYIHRNCTFDLRGGKVIGGTVKGSVDADGANVGGCGGAVYMANMAKMIMTGGEIVGGKAVRADSATGLANGGALYMSPAAQLTISGGTISGGTAEVAGNCVHLEEYAVVNMTGGTIEGYTPAA